jgi:hypothetical protein
MARRSRKEIRKFKCSTGLLADNTCRLIDGDVLTKRPVATSLTRVGHGLDREAQDLIMGPHEIKDPGNSILIRIAHHHVKKGHLDSRSDEVFDCLELSLYDIPPMKKNGCLRLEGIEGEDDVYTHLSQLFTELRIFCKAQAIGVHRDPADLRPFATAQNVEDSRVECWFASSDIDQIHSI